MKHRHGTKTHVVDVAARLVEPAGVVEHRLDVGYHVLRAAVVLETNILEDRNKN